MSEEDELKKDILKLQKRKLEKELESSNCGYFCLYMIIMLVFLWALIGGISIIIMMAK